jgi:hypothetical protein
MATSSSQLYFFGNAKDRCWPASNRRATRDIYRKQKPLNSAMDPYAKPKERRIGAQRPKITHLPEAAETRTRRDREAEKQAVAAERRAIKKSARQHLKRQLQAEMKEPD